MPLTPESREIVALMPDICAAFHKVLLKKFPEEMKLKAKVIVKWAEEGQSMRAIAKNHTIGIHRAHRLINSCISYLNQNAATAADAESLVLGFLNTPARQRGRPGVSDALRARVLSLRNEKVDGKKQSCRAVAKLAGCHPSTVSRILRKLS